MGGGYGGGARFERSLRVTGAGAAEMAWEEATEGERGRRVYAEGRWGWRCRNSMGGRYTEGERGRTADGHRRTKPVKSRVPNFSRKNGTLLLDFLGCGAQGDRYGMWCSV